MRPRPASESGMVDFLDKLHHVFQISSPDFVSPALEADDERLEKKRKSLEGFY